MIPSPTAAFRSDRSRILPVPPNLPAIPTNISNDRLHALAGAFVDTLDAGDENLLDTLSVFASSILTASPNFSALSLSVPTLRWVAASAALPVVTAAGNVSAVLPALGNGLVYSIVVHAGVSNTTGFATFSVNVISAGNFEMGVSNLATPLVFQIAGAAPSSNFSVECVYWNGSAWDTQGCAYVDDACACTHFTEFSARLRAVADANADIFGAAAHDAYSTAGFAKYAPVYGAILGIACALLCAFLWLMRLDASALMTYQGAVEDIDEVCRVLGLEQPPPFIEQPTVGLPTHDADAPWYRRAAYTLCDRLLFQHTWLSIYFKYDPRLPRGFRLLFLTNILFHTLFITTLLYGYSKAGGTMTIAESVVLSLITAALNIPFVKFLVIVMNFVGRTEFAARFPAYAAEYKRRRAFEYALADVATADIQTALEKIRSGESPALAVQRTPRNRRISVTVDHSSSHNDGAHDLATHQTLGGDDTQIALMYICRCRHRRPRRNAHPDGFERAVAIAAQPQTSVESVAVCRASLPTATIAGACVAAAQFAYVGWCLNYLLLFTASQSSEAASAVATSFGISQTTSILFSQPLSIALTLSALIVGRYWARRRSAPATAHHIGYFTDPQYGRQTTSLSGIWAYYIFFYAAATSSVQAGSPSVGIAAARTAVAGLESASAVAATDRDNAVRDFYFLSRGLRMLSGGVKIRAP